MPFRRALELEDPGRETPIQLRPLQFAATIDLLFGRIDEADAALLALRTTILESGEEHELPYVSNLLGFASLLRGDQPAALTYIDEALRTSTVVGSETLAGFAIGMRCLASSLAGDVETARADAIKANAIFDRVAWGIGRFYVAKAMSFLALSLDQPAEIEHDLGPFAAGLGATVGFAAPAYFYGDLIDARLMTGDREGAEPHRWAGRGGSVGRLAVGACHRVARKGAARVGPRATRRRAGSRSRGRRGVRDHGNPIGAWTHHARKGPHPAADASEAGGRRGAGRGPGIFDQAGMRLWVGKVDGELARVGLRSRREIRADRDRTTDRGARGNRADEPRDRGTGVREPADGRGRPVAGVRQAGHPFASRARRVHGCKEKQTVTLSNHRSMPRYGVRTWS